MKTNKMADSLCLVVAQTAKHFRESQGSRKFKKADEQEFIKDLIAELKSTLALAEEWEAKDAKLKRAKREIERLLIKFPKHLRFDLEEVEENKNPIFGYHTDEDYGDLEDVIEE